MLQDNNKMSFKKTLTNLVLIGGLALGGCGKSPEYHYDGQMGDEHVKFYEVFSEGINILEVTKKDGTKIKYTDVKGDDLKIEEIMITKGNEEITYRKDIIGEKVLEEGQKQFDAYLATILEMKQSKGMTDISR